MNLRIFASVVAFALISVKSLSAQTSPEIKPVVEAEQKATDDENVFENVEIEASVNINDWRRHLEKNLIRYIINAAQQNMKAGRYTVQVRFLVEKDGSIADVKALNDPGFGLAQGAVKTVRTGPKWVAGEVNDKKVRSYHTQSIVFIIQEK